MLGGCAFIRYCAVATSMPPRKIAASSAVRMMPRSSGNSLPGAVAAAAPAAQVPEGCPFCHEAALAPGVLVETSQLLVVCDRAPLVPGHLLIIPRPHLACYGALPRTLYSEFRALKARVAEFLAEAYAPPV